MIFILSIDAFTSVYYLCSSGPLSKSHSRKPGNSVSYKILLSLLVCYRVVWTIIDKGRKRANQLSSGTYYLPLLRLDTVRAARRSSPAQTRSCTPTRCRYLRLGTSRAARCWTGSGSGSVGSSDVEELSAAASRIEKRLCQLVAVVV